MSFSRNGWMPAVVLAVMAAVVLALLVWQNWHESPGDMAAGPSRATPREDSTFMPQINKSDDAWRNQLTPEQFEVARRGGTERPFTGQYWNHKEPGKYKCVCCGAPLFDAETKYDSGCGWPSFHTAENPDNLHLLEDRKFGMLRVEVQCKNCGAHLGHVFDDGPQPTGQRYCMNSAALDFEKKPAEKKRDE